MKKKRVVVTGMGLVSCFGSDIDHFYNQLLTGNRKYYDKAISCLEWLEKNRAPGFRNYCWGKHFNYASRGGRYAKLEPITVWTSIIGLVFIDAYEQLKEEKYLEIAVSICDWILEVPRTNTNKGTCIGYTTRNSYCTIHNQSMIAAAMLAKTARYSENSDYLELANSAMAFSCNSQLTTGGWYYGENHNTHWIDNFHSGYNLDALKCYIEYSNDNTFVSNLEKGFEFYRANFFDRNGRPKYYHNRMYPIDIQCASQAIDTLAKFSDQDESSLGLALKVADWTIKNMQDKKGYFYYRRYPIIKNRTPMIHWGQATMFKALSMLVQLMK